MARASVAEGADEITVIIRGEMDEVAPGSLGRVVDSIPREDGRPIIVDIDGVPRLGALGVAALTTLVGALQERGHEVSIRAGDPALRRTLGVFSREVPEPEPPGPEAMDLVERLGERTIQARETATRYVILLVASLKHALLQVLPGGRRRGDVFTRSVVGMGVGATALVALIAFLIGAILALQGGSLLRRYGQSVLIADLVGLSIVKEIGPLLTAILVAGRSGSALTAEIGTMRVSEEVDALEVMGVDPVGYLVAPRLRALCLVLPLLTAIADVVGIAGGLVVAATVYDVTPSVYLDQTLNRIELDQVLGGLLKAFCFAIVIVSASAHEGFSTAGGAAGVGKYTTRAVVRAIIWIIVVDAFFTSVLTAADW